MIENPWKRRQKFTKSKGTHTKKQGKPKQGLEGQGIVRFESCDSKVAAIVALNIDTFRLGLAILRRFSAILLCCDSTHLCAFGAEILAIPGLRFWSRTIHDSSVPLSSEQFQRPVFAILLESMKIHL